MIQTCSGLGIPIGVRCKILVSKSTFNPLRSQTSDYAPTLKTNWICNPNFHMCTNITNKSCKMVIEHASYINIMSSKVADKARLTVIMHPQPCQMSWIDNIIQEVKQRCIVPINFNAYKANVGYDVVASEWRPTCLTC